MSKKLDLSDRQEAALKSYGKWRPRIGRGAQFAGTTAVISGVTGKKKLALPASIAAGTVGVADKMLEEKAKKDRGVRKLVGEGFKTAAASSVKAKLKGIGEPAREDLSFNSGARASHTSATKGLMQELFSRKARMASLADSQLKELWPSSNESSYGRAVTMGRSASDASKTVTRAMKTTVKG